MSVGADANTEYERILLAFHCGLLARRVGGHIAMVTVGGQAARAVYVRVYDNSGPLTSRPYLRLKRAFDVLVALALGLLLFVPFFFVVAPIIVLDGGPIFYAQRRIGAGGRRFDCYKFRSMVPHAERLLGEICSRDPTAQSQWEQNRKLDDDPRVTYIGRFLRKSSLDELPQLWNVIKGDMSLVGPRPIVDEEVERYGRYIGNYLSRRPGLTGLWQVHGRHCSDYRRRVAMDVWYAKHVSLSLDLVLLVQTIAVVLNGRGV